jgi:acetoin utilization protein AcuB
MRISEIMSTPARVVGLRTTANAAWEAMRLHRTHHLVVTDSEGRVLGVVSASDLGGKHGERVRNGRLVSDLMTEKVVATAPDTTVREAANLMRGHTVNCLPVFKDGKLAGIVTTLDLLELIGRGAERPVATARRAVLKNRGELPHGQTVAKKVGRARRGVQR